MRDIDRGEWRPVPDWKVFTVLGIITAVDVTAIALAVWYFLSKGWL